MTNTNDPITTTTHIPSYTRMTRKEFHTLVRRLEPTKDALQKRFHEGLTLAQWYKEEGITRETALDALECIEVKAEKAPAATSEDRIAAMERQILALSERMTHMETTGGRLL